MREKNDALPAAIFGACLKANFVTYMIFSLLAQFLLYAVLPAPLNRSYALTDFGKITVLYLLVAAGTGLFFGAGFVLVRGLIRKPVSTLALDAVSRLLAMAGLLLILIIFLMPHYGPGRIGGAESSEKLIAVSLLFACTGVIGFLIRKPLLRMKTAYLYLAAIIVAAGAIIAGSSWGEEKPGFIGTSSRISSSGRPNVVLLLIDTLRADHVEPGREGGADTPHLDELAEGGIRFTRMVSQNSWTRPSVASILTSRYPVEHMAGWVGTSIPESVPTMSELLKDNGYRTIGIGNNSHLDRGFGFARGFDVFDISNTTPLTAASPLMLVGMISKKLWVKIGWFHPTYHSARFLTESAVGILDGMEPSDAPYFLYMHYIDPHGPYFSDGFNAFHPMPEPGNIPILKALYNEEITFTDRQVGVLLEEMDSRGLLANTLVVVTSDHGEEFYEHGEWEHGKNMYNESLRVPMIMYYPGIIEPGQVSDRLVETVDIMPSILGLCGLECPDCSGFDLLDPAGRDVPGDPVAADGDGGGRYGREAYGDFASAPLNDKGFMMFSVQTPTWKYIRTFKDSVLVREELFDLAADEWEQHDLSAAKPEITAYFAERIAAHRKRQLDPSRAAAISESLDPTVAEQIKALGYID